MIIKRSEHNPILQPNRKQAWEAEAVFNGCPVEYNGKIYLFYRALSLFHYHAAADIEMRVSDIGIAESKDGVHFENRRRIIYPEHSWERYGCEDPRVTKLDDKFYIFYTAMSEYPFRAEGIKVGVAISKDLKKIDEKHLVTPFNAKGMALFPEKIGGKIWGILTVNTDKPPSKICLVGFDKEEDIWSKDYWNNWYKDLEKWSLPLQRTAEDHVEVGAPPIKTEYGWLVLYSYIKKYFTSEPLFTIEAVLLDLENPFKILARTSSSMLAPEEYYEKIGFVKNIVFPSGALLKGKDLYIYYGGADTVCCLAHIELSCLIDHMVSIEIRKTSLLRASENPIIKPIPEHPWESKATFNPAALRIGDKVHIVYRAMSKDNTSVMGYATSTDGIQIDYRANEPIYVPRESFEQKNKPNGNSGCEDPRLTLIDDRVYMCYTAFDSKNPPRVALTSISVNDFVEEKRNWEKPILISQPKQDNKDAFVFPEKVNGKYMIVHRSGNDIDLAFIDSLVFKQNIWLEEHRWIAPRKGWWDSEKVGAAAPPIKTKDGWVMLYHGISENMVYRVGAVLLDLKNPVEVIARTDNPIFEPLTKYEREGEISNVVFPCGNVIIDGKLFVYYGGADKVLGVATMKMKELVDLLKFYSC